jgi:hypothetical protein
VTIDNKDRDSTEESSDNELGSGASEHDDEGEYDILDSAEDDEEEEEA